MVRCFFFFPVSSRFCGADGSRTRDLMLAEHALYQLSYDPLFFGRQKYKNFVYLCHSKPNNRKKL